MLESEISVVNVMIEAYNLSLYLRQEYNDNQDAFPLSRQIPFLLHIYYIPFENLMGRAPTRTELRFMLGPLIELDKVAFDFLRSPIQFLILKSIFWPR